MTKDEVLKLALEKFEFMNHVDSIFEGEFNFQINAIKEALAQPEQKPVGLIESLKDAQPCCGEYQTCWRACTPRGKFLAQRTWVGLTEEDLKLLSAEWRIVYGAWMDDFARDIEAKLKEKNT